MTEAAIYARQSEDIAEGIDRQLSRCRSLIEARGWTVGKVYRDNDISASKERGPGTAWAAMLEDLRRGSVSIVVAVDLDRLLRSTRDLLALTVTGAKVLTVDGEIDLTSADGEFRATMLSGIARFETRRKGERQVRANSDRATKGIPNPGRRRYGYETDGRTPREEEAVIVRRIFGHVAAGGSFRSIMQALRSEGVPAGTGKGAWSMNRVRELILNPHYAGQMRYQGAVYPSDYITPIVDPVLAETARAVATDPSRRTTPGPKPRHLLSGLAVCGVCGVPMHFMRTYRCKVDTTHPSITKAILEPYVLDELAKDFLGGGPDLELPDAADADVVALSTEHARNAAAVSATMADRDEGLVPASIARARLLELREERERIETALEELRVSRSAAGALRSLMDRVILEMHPLEQNYRALRDQFVAAFTALDLDDQREVLRSLLFIEIAPGRDVRTRVSFQHLRAPHLDADAGYQTTIEH